MRGSSPHSVKTGVTRVTGVTNKTNLLIINNIFKVTRESKFEQIQCNGAKSCNNDNSPSLLLAAATHYLCRWYSTPNLGRRGDLSGH